MIIETLAALALQSSTSGEIRPARQIDPYALCSCANADKSNLVSFTGVASDAQMTLGPDGRSAEARQATIFRVVKGKSAEVPDPAKVWHVTDPAKCGVKFDYGKRYAVTAVRKENGELETSYCVMPKSANESLARNVFIASSFVTPIRLHLEGEASRRAKANGLLPPSRRAKAPLRRDGGRMKRC